jgi:hypothetical protein
MKTLVTDQTASQEFDSTPPSASNPIWASVAAIASVLAASSCCLPVLPFLFAAGAAGSSALLTAARPYLLAASVLFIACAFYQAWRAKRCARQPGVISAVLLWTSTVFVVVAIFFPQVMANAAASLMAR